MSRVELHRAYKFRLYPTPAQVAELSEWERQLRRLYNLGHSQRLASMDRYLRPKSPGLGKCDCDGPRVDGKKQHAAACASLLCQSCGGSKTEDGIRHAPGCFAVECRSCGATAVDGKTVHTVACSFVDYYRQGREMTELLRSDDKLARVVCSARQEVLRDLDKAWQRWRKAPQQWGKPRFKRRTDSCRIYLPTPSAWKVDGLGSLSFAGAAASVGRVKILQDRPWPGDAKFSSCHVVRDGDEWYAVFPLVFSREVVCPKGGTVGINRGAIHAIADSYGRVVDSPKYYARALGVIRHRARLLARKVPFDRAVKPSPTKYRGLSPADVDSLAVEIGTSPGRVVYEAKKRGSIEAARLHLVANPPPALRASLAVPSDGRNRERARQYLARAHQRVRRQREWFLHNESAYYTRGRKIDGRVQGGFQRIAFEDWSTKEMTSSEPQELGDKRELRRVTRGRNRSILDVGWYELGRQLKYKAEATGAQIAEVDPGLRETETIASATAVADRDADVSGLLKGEAGISGTCSACGALLPEAASGHRDAVCEVCLAAGLGDVNAAVNVLKRALFPENAPAPAEKKRVSIGIRGRKKRAA